MDTYLLLIIKSLFCIQLIIQGMDGSVNQGREFLKCQNTLGSELYPESIVNVKCQFKC